MFIILRLDDRLVEIFRGLPPDYIMNAIEVAPSFPGCEQSGDCVGESVFESGNNDSAGAPFHPLHVPQCKGGGDAVGLTSAASGNYHRSIRPNQLRESLGFIKVNSLRFRFRRFHFQVDKACRVEGQAPRIQHLGCRLSLLCISLSTGEFFP